MQVLANIKRNQAKTPLLDPRIVLCLIFMEIYHNSLSFAFETFWENIIETKFYWCIVSLHMEVTYKLLIFFHDTNLIQCEQFLDASTSFIPMHTYKIVSDIV